MNTLPIERALELIRMQGGDRITITMDTRRFAPGSVEADSTRLRNLLRSAEQELVMRDLRPAAIDTLLAPARALLDDRPFWLRSTAGLLLLIGPEGIESFRLRAASGDSVFVGDRYRLRQILPLLERDGTFWLLAISQKRVRLFEGTQSSLDEVPAEGVPASLAEAMQWDDFEKASLQFHSGSGSRGPAIFHGTGETEIKDELAGYFRAIDRGLREHLRDSTAPLLLAGVEYLLPIYREVNTYPHLADEAVLGNPDDAGVRELHAAALEVTDRLAGAVRAGLAREVEEAWGSSRTTPDPETIVPAARHGRVKTLLLSDAAEWWGVYDDAAARVSIHRAPQPGDEDLLDRAALDTLEHGGSLVSLPAADMPRAEGAIALLRY